MNNTTEQTLTASVSPNDSLSDLYCSDPRKACRKALALTRNLPENDRLEAINSLLGLHGTEAIRGEWKNGYWCDIVAAYCNTGDCYKLTVIQQRGSCRYDSSRFFVGTVGDFVERNSAKLGII